MKRLSYPNVKLGFERLFSLVSKGEKYQNSDVVQKANDILCFLAKPANTPRDENSAFVPIPFEVYHPALSNVPR